MAALAMISHASWLKAAQTQRLMAALDAARPNASRFVGGCVRNALMGKPVDDIDIATQLLPDETIAAAKAAGLAAHPTGIEHGTITIVADHVPFEVTTLRRDVSTDGRRASVAFTEDWAEDAQRRDFRMNALYAGADGVIFDPTGGGLDDVRAGRVVFVGDAKTRILEDHLRILRFFRFNAWYGRGDLDADGLEACAALRDTITNLSVERVWKETKKLLCAPDPRASMDAMRRAGVEAIALPEATKTTRQAQMIDLETELMLAGDAMTRLAAALPDQEAARALAQRLKLSNEERARLVAALGDDEKIVCYMSLREVRRALYRLGPEAFRDRAMLAWAEAGLAKAVQWRALLALADGWSRPKFPLTGEEAMVAGAKPGPMVGQVLREVEAWWIDSDFIDDKLSLVERLKAVVQGLS